MLSIPIVFASAAAYALVNPMSLHVEIRERRTSHEIQGMIHVRRLGNRFVGYLYYPFHLSLTAVCHNGNLPSFPSANDSDSSALSYLVDSIVSWNGGYDCDLFECSACQSKECCCCGKGDDIQLGTFYDAGEAAPATSGKVEK